MKLYLSSYRLGNHPESLQELAGTNKKTAVICNSMDNLELEKRVSAVSREIADMKELGFEPEELDLRKYFDNPSALDKKLNEYGIVWARGGNAFLLRAAMNLSGFDNLLVKRLDMDNDFVYAGYSAGIVVLAPTLEGIDIVDDIHAKPFGYDAKPITRGIGIIDFCIAPHYHSDHPESPAIDKVVEYFQQKEIPFKTLHDGEAIVINDTSESIAR
jgi:dipeptidase E